MRNKSRQWWFFESDDRPAITPEEAHYWLNLVPKLLKVGVEFEFNLRAKENMCRGDNIDCDCIHVNSGCALECVRTEECNAERIKEDCVNINSPVCSGNCKKCDNFLLNCPGIFCLGFQSKCISCSNFKINCKTCEYKYEPEKDPAKIRARVVEALKPTNNWGIPGEHCVAEVTKDGSLENSGIEVTTVGRRLDYISFYEMTKKIIDLVEKKGGYVNERTSIHMHFLTAYYRSLNKSAKERGEAKMNTTDLEKPMPEIILANIHQLFRRYQNALTWMSMGLDNPDKLTRWEKFRVSILPYSPLGETMHTIRDRIMSKYKDYGFVNYDNCRFSKNGKEVTRFHIELRFMDNIPCPTIVTAFACLKYAMIMKAVELSRYGLLEVGDKDWMSLSMEMKDAILNNCPREFGNDRFGYTERVAKYERYYKEQGMELLQLVKHTLMEFGPQVYDQLAKILERPVCYDRVDGLSWKEIEEKYYIPLREEERISHVIQKIIDLRMITECETLGEWLDAVWTELHDMFPEELGVTKQSMAAFVKEQISNSKLQWSEPLGTVI